MSIQSRRRLFDGAEVVAMASVATIADVAAHAGVSVATVSRALRCLPGVSEFTRARVMTSAQQVGYVLAPMPLARPRGPASRVAVVLARVDTWFFGCVLGAIGTRLTALGCIPEMHILDDQARRNAFFTGVGSSGRLAGVIVVGMPLLERECALLTSLPCPVVGLHSALDTLPTVDSDDELMARWAVEHLVGLGHRRIAMISSEPGEPVSHRVPEARRGGYLSALAAAGIAHRAELEVCGADSPAGGQEAAARLLVGRHAPTAMFVHTDEMAFGVLAALAGAGLSVPGDVSVVSIDDHPLAPALRLTTVAHDVTAQAAKAADLLVHAGTARSDGRQADLPELTVRTPRLIIRATTAPPRRPRTRRPRQLAGAGT
jgi:DNA-binding LacI/PurR family transcriptional regulator